MPPEWVNTDTAAAIYAMCKVLAATLAASTLVALFTLVLVELSQGYFRRAVQQFRFQRWVERPQEASRYAWFTIQEGEMPIWLRQALAEASLDPEEWATSDRTLKPKRSGIDHPRHPWTDVLDIGIRSNEIFMREVQVAADAIMDEPQVFLQGFLRLGSYAPLEDLQTLAVVDDLRSKNPDVLAKLLAEEELETHPNRAATAIAAAQDSVSRSVNRNLDNLQLDLASAWKAWSYMMYVLYGAMLAIAASMLGGGMKIFIFPTIIIVVGIGCFGGIVAGSLKTLTHAFWARNR